MGLLQAVTDLGRNHADIDMTVVAQLVAKEAGVAIALFHATEDAAVVGHVYTTKAGGGGVMEALLTHADVSLWFLCGVLNMGCGA